MKNKFFKLVIVGLGNIGSRYLEGTLKSNINLEIYCVDKKNIIKKKKASNKYKNLSKNIFFMNDFESLPNKIDILIIATTSNIRFNIATKLIELKQISNLILEKVVFQRKSHFHNFFNIISKKKIPAFISLPRRYYPIYRHISEMNLKSLHINIDANQLGLGCNLIHFIDLFTFLTANKDIEFINFLDEKIIEAKRKNFIEFTGNIKIFSKNSSFIIKDNANLDLPKKLLIKIKFNNKIVIIDEIKKIVKINNVRSKRFESFPLMSDLWQNLPSDILIKNYCELPKFQTNYKVHIEMINFFNNHLSKILNKRVYVCKIS